MRFAHFLTPAILFVIFSNPVFAQLEKPDDKPLIAKPNSALAGIKELSVAITLSGSEPNAEGLEADQLKNNIIGQLYDAGFAVSRSSMEQVLAIPQLSVDIGMLKLESCGQYAIFVQTALLRGVAMPGTERTHITADVWKSESGLLSVSAEGLPAEVNAIVQKQVQAFISACSVAGAVDEHPDANQMKPRLRKTPAVQDTKPEKQQNIESKYVASKNSKVFHKPDCPSANRILPANLITYNSREEAIAAGRRPCQRCNP